MILEDDMQIIDVSEMNKYYESIIQKPLSEQLVLENKENISKFFFQ